MLYGKGVSGAGSRRQINWRFTSDRRKSARFGLETSTAMNIAVYVQAVLGDSHLYALLAKDRQELMPLLI